MYQASAPRFANMLRNLSAILDKAKAHAAAKKIDERALTSARLYPDMFTMARQVQVACDTAKACVARLAGVEIPKHEDTEETFDELKARIAKTIAFLETFRPAQIDGSEERDIVFMAGNSERRFKGRTYLLGHAYLNFYFHCATAYDLLRHSGVEIGKRDFIGNPDAVK
jgi:hypothetical protein